MYSSEDLDIFDKSWAESSLFELSHGEKKYEILNKQVKILTSQYIGTCKSAYTKCYALNWALTKVQCIGTCKSSYTNGCNLNRVLTSNMERQEYIDTITELKAMISSLKLTLYHNSYNKSIWKE